MIRSRIYVLAVVLAACSDAPLVPDGPEATPQRSVVDPDPAQALASTSSSDRVEVIATFDAATTVGDVLQAAIPDLGADALGFSHLPMVAALATPSESAAVAAARARYP